MMDSGRRRSATQTATIVVGLLNLLCFDTGRFDRLTAAEPDSHALDVPGMFGGFSTGAPSPPVYDSRD